MKRSLHLIIHLLFYYINVVAPFSVHPYYIFTNIQWELAQT